MSLTAFKVVLIAVNAIVLIFAKAVWDERRKPIDKVITVLLAIVGVIGIICTAIL